MGRKPRRSQPVSMRKEWGRLRGRRGRACWRIQISIHAYLEETFLPCVVRDRRPNQTVPHHAAIVMDGGTQDQLEPVGGNPETSLYRRKEKAQSE